MVLKLRKVILKLKTQITRKDMALFVKNKVYGAVGVLHLELQQSLGNFLHPQHLEVTEAL